ncbi:MAG: tRNA(5-methylaminomethyl-2-thiouridylate) methyltransferase [Desulfovibrionales bacterium]|nr:tRNA(5-methylaminomethyl-2-thiouridylate) methyltransferase [Desulfovibrionales bacterium]
MNEQYDALSLFSGGLDGILASKLIQGLGHKVLGLHFISPFFGRPERVPGWVRTYGLPIDIIDIGQEFVDLMAAFPPHGFGKVMNPCVDCKILMLRLAKKLLPQYGAKFLITGEVLGQRPMSQRADTLNVIRNEAQVHDILLRPLSAGLLPPTPMEESGVVDRAKLPALCGRGRKSQYQLAKILGVTTIPPQAGACRLGERESARRYWPVMQTFPNPQSGDFVLANVGRQLWRRLAGHATGHWLVMGREQKDNERLQELTRSDDYVFMLKSFPGPHAVGRQVPGQVWREDVLHEAATCLACFSAKARRHGGMVEVVVRQGEAEWTVTVNPASPHNFTDNLTWAETREAQKDWEKSVLLNRDEALTPAQVRKDQTNTQGGLHGCADKTDGIF